MTAGSAPAADTRIERLSGVVFRLPLRGALAWGKGSSLEVAEHVLVRVHLRGGLTGVAEAPPRPTIYGETPASILGILVLLEERLRGMDITDSGGLAAALGSVVHNNAARGALDMALHDARAQAAGETLFGRLLGPQTRVRASFILGIAPGTEMLAEARRVVEAGVRVLKVKVGRDHARDLTFIRE
ncbi:MAG: enolase, partial [Deinococcus sp.]